MTQVVVEPQPGPQAALLACPAQEVFYGGARGGGKTHGIILDWLNHYIKYGAHCQGVLFRRSYPELEGIIEYCHEILPQFSGVYSYTRKTWTFSGGATLLLRHLDSVVDASRYQGRQFTWEGFDEIGAWGDFTALWMLKACLRNVHGIPSRMVLTGNPGGPGQALIKNRYIDGSDPYDLVPDEDTPDWFRTYIPSRVADNRILMENDPGYADRLRMVGSDWLVRAWLEGDFSAAPDSYLGGIWDDDKYCIDPFPIPEHWKRFRALDWGFAAPYAVGWFAQDEDHNLYLYRELYGRGKGLNKGTRQEASDVARQILEIEEKERAAGIKFVNNPADSAMWMEDGRYKSIFDMFTEAGCHWTKASKGAGSRINGAQEVVRRLRTDSLKVFSTCKNFLRTVPSIPADPKNFEDVDSEVEDHAWDMLRYALMSRQPKTRELAPGSSIAGTFDWVSTHRKPHANPIRFDK